jgi:tetratricopeptide (TPR) repeat protein
MDKHDPPDDLDSAIAHHEAGRLAVAEKLYREILGRDPNELDALHLLGVILQERGELARSIELISRALEIEPDFPEALTHLARAQRAAGQAQRAAANARRAMALDPDLPEAPLMLCGALLDLGNDAEAADAGRRAVALAPASYDAYACLGLALENLKDWRAAAAAYQTAVELEPTRPATLIRLATALSELGQYYPAIRYFREATSLAPDERLAHAGLGVALQRGEDTAGSIAAFQRALELAPDRADVWHLQGRNFDAIGQFDEAAACYNRSLELDPGSAEVRRSLANIGKLENGASEIASLGGVLANTALPVLNRIAAGFALGTLLDKTGVYDGAFQAFETANTLARAYHAARGESFDIAKVRRDIDSRIKGFDRGALAAAGIQGNPSELPVFVVGMPRSGTTLVEQIAASHERVHAVGETRDMDNIIRRLGQQQPGVHPALWDREAVRREAEDHLSHLRAVAGHADRVVDKLPDNILMLGEIAVLFPRARVIICRRDPRDVCLSCYFQQFDDPTPWSLDLSDCAARASEITRLMDFWSQRQPLRILRMDYEALVGDLEGQSRRLIDFLGLEWDPACLDFHKTDRKVLTASQWQVRQPLYASSVGRWKHYRRHLGPMLARLQGLVPHLD